MYVSSIRVKNYRSIDDSGDLKFGLGFNVVVGANNSGKSTLLAAITGRITGEPHATIVTSPSADEPAPDGTTIQIRCVTSGSELFRVLYALGNADCFFPWPEDVAFNAGIAREVLARLENAEKIELTGERFGGRGQEVAHWRPVGSLATNAWRPHIGGGAYGYVRFASNGGQRIRANETAMEDSTNFRDTGLAVLQRLTDSVYLFRAERLTIGDYSRGPSTVLAPDCSNLPEVLDNLKGNPSAMDHYCALVSEVLPSVRRVTTHPAPTNVQNRVELRVWQHDPATERDDLAVPLLKCGTGVSQVLAILYVVKTSRFARTIIIDEPGSFLHPGAVRSLIAILKRYKQHQYIISTHSAEVIAELKDATFTIVKAVDARSTFTQHAGATRPVAETALREVGVKLSDVFGYDSVLWVEGPSDAEALKLMLAKLGRPQSRLGILPVRNTGDFEGRKTDINQVLGIYSRLGHSDALLPPAVRMLFDRDGRSPDDMRRAETESGRVVRFLQRRMFENYCLDTTAIAMAYNASGEEFGLTTTAEDVRRWIDENGREQKYFPRGGAVRDVWTAPWHAEVHAAGLLKDLFESLSDARNVYVKTTHTPLLAAFLAEANPDAALQLVAELDDVLEPALTQ